MHRLLLALATAALVCAGPAGADVIRAPGTGGLIVGTNRADTLIGGKENDRIDAAYGGVDTVRCGGGRDTVSADFADVVAADCEIVSRRLSVDPTTNPESQHETAVEPDSFSHGSTVVAAFQLGRFAQGAASAIGAAVSTDAGRTWTRTTLPGLTVESTPAGAQLSASDPTVAYDTVHGVWLVGTLTVESGSAYHVLVSRSLDGLGWAKPVTVATGRQLDKDWFACDNGATSPFRGRCYAAYTDDAAGATVVQHSNDGGVTWSQPVTATSLLVGTQPVVLPNGTLVVVAGDYDGAAALTGSIDSVVSTDGGVTFTRSVVSMLTSDSNAPLRAFALPSVDVDAAGKIYAVWSDCRFRAGCDGNDLVLSTSTDGLAWSPPARIPLTAAGARVDAFLPGLAADPAQPGHLGLVYGYWEPGSCRSTCLLDIGFASSTDGGASWSVPLQLNPRPVDPSWLARSKGGRMVGDYFSTSVAGGRFVPVFTLAEPPLRGRFREAVFGASLPANPLPSRTAAGAARRAGSASRPRRHRRRPTRAGPRAWSRG